MDDSQTHAARSQAPPEPEADPGSAAPAWACIVEDVAHPAAVLDARGGVRRANASFAACCGLRAQDIEGCPLSQAWPRLWQVLAPQLDALSEDQDGSPGPQPLVLSLPAEAAQGRQATLRAIESGKGGSGESGSGEASRLFWLLLRPQPEARGPVSGEPNGSAEASSPPAQDCQPLQVLAAEPGPARGPGPAAQDTARLLEALLSERALAQEAERRHLLLSESIPQIAWVAEPDGTVSYINGRGAAYFGTDVESSQGAVWADFVHPEDVAQAQQRWQQALESRSAFEVRYRLRSHDGSFRWFLGLGLPLLDGDGRVQQWAGTCTDIDAPQRAEEALRLLADAGAILTSSLDESRLLQALARRLVSGFADWCFFERLRPDGQLEPLALLHADPANLAALDELRRHFVLQRLATGTGSVVRTAEPELLPSIGAAVLDALGLDEQQRKYLLAVGLASLIRVPLLARGEVLGVLTLARGGSRAFGREDLELAQEVARRAAASLDNAALYGQAQRALQAAEEAARVKDSFLATVSHELRTPLTAILGWANLLKSGRVDAEMTRHALETIERNVKAQAQIVEDLLDVSRIVAGKLRLETRPVELAPIVAAAIESVRPAIDARGIVLDFRCCAASPSIIAGDAMRLQQIVWNILSNAVKFTPRGGRIAVSIESDGSQLSLSVGDSGPGVAVEFAPYIFERFRQADSSPTRRHGGLGLGLAIVRHLVEMHGGSVRLEPPVEGEGAIFVVELPVLALAEPYEEPVQADEDGYASLMLKGKRVLVVEDEADSRELLQIVLSRFGAIVSLAAGAGEAWRALEAEPPDVLVSDIGMPGEDGYALIRRVRARFSPEQLPAIALTAYAASSDREQALQAGFNAHVTKPAVPIHLAMTVAGLLEPRRTAST